MFYIYIDIQVARICLQCRSHRRCGFNPWLRKNLWKKKWQPTPVILRIPQRRLDDNQQIFTYME